MVGRSIAGKPKKWRSRAALQLLDDAGQPEIMAEAVTAAVSRIMDGVLCPPTDLAAVASRVNVEACIAEDMPGSGELRRTGTGFTIYYSSYLSVHPRRFTIAHEIGHALLETSSHVPPKQCREVERLCDMIAAEILMPRRLMEGRLKDRPNLKLVFEISKTFQVSLSAAAVRCAELSSVTVFGVEGSRVVWANGFVRRGPVDGLGSDLRAAVDKAVQGLRAEEEVMLDGVAGFRPWRLEYTPLNKGRAIFLLQPIPWSQSRRRAAGV
jgi:hypothetical protein